MKTVRPVTPDERDIFSVLQEWGYEVRALDPKEMSSSDRRNLFEELSDHYGEELLQKILNPFDDGQEGEDRAPDNSQP
jgi:hypothetical protein